MIGMTGEYIDTGEIVGEMGGMLNVSLGANEMSGNINVSMNGHFEEEAHPDVVTDIIVNDMPEDFTEQQHFNNGFEEGTDVHENIIDNPHEVVGDSNLSRIDQLQE